MKKSPRLPNPAKPRYSLRRDLKMNWQLYLMAAPAVILLFIFGYMMDFGAIMAFQELDYNKGLFTSPFVGFKNFEYLFAGTTIWRVTRNTVFYNLAFMAVNSLTSIGLALIINEMTNKKVSKVIQTILIMPYFLSMVVVSIIVYSFLAYNSGFLNNTLIKFGLDKQNWYKMPEVWPYFIVFINMWKNVGFSSITYTAIISGIGKAATSIVSVGKNIVTGLWSGVSSMISWVKNKISGFVGDIVGGIKSLLGIHSPSRVFAGIGDNMAKGLGEGFTDEMDKVSKDINNAIPTDFDVDARVGANAQTSGSGSGGTVITYTGPLVSVAQMVVRSEDDIRKVSQGLYNLMQSGTRAQGIIPIT